MESIELIKVAWQAREYAHPWRSGTKVGCAIQVPSGEIARGWNIEGLWQTSLHAEVVAISQLIPFKEKGIAIAIASETENFTPCGACYDWLIQFCESDACVIIANRETSRQTGLLRELYPHYPHH